MKKQTNPNRPIRTNLVLAMAMASWLPTAATAADEPMNPMKARAHQMMPTDTNTEQTVDGKMMMQGCQTMKEKKKKMMAEMKTQDTELTERVAKMNGAPEEKKTDLMAAIVTQLVEQRTAMNARKAKMQDEMMKHMMQHMQMGKDSMAQCPMMKGMKGMDEKSPAAHKDKEHHPEQK